LRFFTDSNFIIALNNPRESDRNKKANEILKRLNKYGLIRNKFELVITNLILAEVMNLILKKRTLPAAKRIFQEIISNFQIIEVSDIKINKESFEQYCCQYWNPSGRTLGLTDGITLFIMRSKGIGLLLSFEEAFDSIAGIRRLSEPDEIEELIPGGNRNK
jgi:predicted nucleic acid-binding protein